jgi:hypothetical protein
MTTTIDLSLIRDVVAGALDAIKSLDGAEIDDTTLGNKPAEARLNQELLNLADQLQLAPALVHNECWTGKGLLSYGL